MNPSQPVLSQIGAVSFGVLSSADVRSLSAKRIISATTFDTLLNPIPGGLYSPELGNFGDNPCATCGFKFPQCPGHCGHIELPVHCYHTTFLDQILRFMRASCVYCHRLKMSRIEVHRMGCKLKLVKYGLLEQVKEIDQMTIYSTNAASLADIDSGSEDDSDNQTSSDSRALMELRDRFVKDAISAARENGGVSVAKTEASTAVRKAIISEFMANITKGKKCSNCGGVNHSYRKDRFVKIFRKPLSEKERLAMIQSGHRAKDPLIELRKKALRELSRKRKRDEDEAVADLELTDDEGDDVNMDDEEESEGEPEIAGGMIEDAAVMGRTPTKKAASEEYLNPNRVHAHLTQVFEREQEILNLVYGIEKRSSKDPGASADMFFMKDILVPPNKYRPEAKTGNNEIAESPDNTLYKNILTACDQLALLQRELSGKIERNPRYRARTYADFEESWVTLQDAVNSLVDRDRNPLQGAAAKRLPDGIKQKLEKKEGIFRKNMMGKRVNFAARTVISPDPNIETNEIGVPPVFAIKLTYPEPVTAWNLEELQEAVRNGPRTWPGAAAIENETGQVVSLERKTADERNALANQLMAPSATMRGTRPKKVHRHLNNGDIVIMNRQPTLHKPSMMCHRARVLPGEKTLRMHYANCNTYNADFDGDEMNMHFPQNENARAEALTIADTDHQYLSATAGNPLRGLIQDHISMGVWLSSRDTFFTRGDYMQLLYAALRPENGHCSSGRIETIPPAMIKPKALWTGKQVITSILLNITPNSHEGLTMTSKSSTDAKLWGRSGAEEQIVIVHEGYLCSGVMDKKQIGSAPGGIVNAVYEVYGHTIAGKFLSILGRLLTRLENMRALSCGVEDLVFTKSGEEARRKALSGAATVGLNVAAKYVGLEEQNPKSYDRELLRRLEDVTRDDAKLQGLDQLTSGAISQISTAVTTTCLPYALVKPFPKNQMQTMTMSGAKGSMVNANQISCNLGQQTLEGRRVPVMISGKTLPCFKPFESSVRAGGYIVDRFLTGVRPQEFFFHAMAGREGLIDTAVKTSRSGYLQRCVIKGMEGLRVEHDSSVRDADGSVIQFLYGEDGLDVTKSKYLKDFKFAAENHLSIMANFGDIRNWSRVWSKEANEYAKTAEKQYRKTGDLGASDPGLSVYPPGRYAGSVSERMYREMRAYQDNNPDKVIKDEKKGIAGVGDLTKKNFQKIQDVRYLKSVVDPGEAVGVVAGQSIGEPSTQMTLNTFHLAGHAAKNVTLGIPRLREIVMTAAKKLATPTMTLRLNEEMSRDEAKKFAKGISKLSMAEIIDKVTVTESIGKGVSFGEAKKYEIRLDFFPKEEYEREYAITVSDVVVTLEHRLLPRLQAAARKELKKRGEEQSLKTQAKSDALPEVGKSSGVVEQENNVSTAEREGGDDDSDGEGDDDATRDKTKGNRQQAGYDAYEDDEEAALGARNRQGSPAEESEDETYGGSPRSANSSDEDVDSSDEESARSLKSQAKDRENRIRADRRTNDVSKFSFNDKTGAQCTFTLEYDSATPKILMLHLVESALHAALIQSVPNISNAMLDEAATDASFKDGKRGAPIVALSGVNIPAMWEYQHIIHPHHIYTNSVGDMLLHYGIEAARASIALELQGVFGAHGISVDPRHLSLIADYMTRDGVYQAFNRMGYRGNASPFMKMSFETTLAFLRDAVTEGDWDDLTNPSARIVVGRLGRMGTGSFDVFLPLQEQKQEMQNEVEMEEDEESE